MFTFHAFDPCKIRVNESEHAFGGEIEAKFKTVISEKWAEWAESGRAHFLGVKPL
jgi:hypothetical protein